MISTRLLYGTIVGCFTLALGIFAFIRQPRRRLNRAFALYTLFAAVSYMTGYAFFLPNHSWALFLYRFSYVSLPLSIYFITVFIQELNGIHDEPDSKRSRRALLWITLVLGAADLTPWVIRDFVKIPNLPLQQIPGPLYAVNSVVIVLALLWLIGSIFSHLRTSVGLRRNQLKFIAFCVGLAVVGAVARCISFLTVDHIWTYVLPYAAINVVFAYLIFHYQLFEFQVWMRRLAVYAGMYSLLIALPVILLPELPSLFTTPIKIAGWLIVYAVLFSLASSFAANLIARYERKKWTDLHEQLELVRTTASELANQRDLSASMIADRICQSLHDFYWNHLKNPLSFVLVGMVADRSPNIASHPNLKIESTILMDFLTALQDHPIARENHFSTVDLDRIDEDENQDRSLLLKHFLRTNNIEVCLPCIHQDKIFGAIFLGSKERGIFWPEELGAIQTTAYQAAAAAHRHELTTQNRELLDLDQMKRTLITHITHEFKSPLAMIESSLQILLGDIGRARLDDEKRRELLTLAQENSARLGTFIQNLLDLARIQQARVDLHRENVDLGPLIRESVERIRSAAEARGLQVLFSENDAVAGYLDPEKTAQVIDNLLSNALKFTQKGEISLELKKEGPNARIVVRDTGCGIDPRFLNTIFESFSQAPENQALNPKGTGLGLAIAKGWVEAQGGQIRAESEGLGRGTRFVVELPLG